MKKLLLTACTCLALTAASAQDFKPFKVNLSLGYAKPAGPGASGGVLVSAEPKYGWNDYIDFGFRMEGAMMARAVMINDEAGEGEIKFSGSYLLTTTMLLTDTYVRPYVGFGAGLYRSAGMGVSADAANPEGDVAMEASNKFGGMLRAGLKMGHFVLGAEYNLVPSTKYSLSTGDKIKGTNSYLGVKLGFDIGGGRTR